MKVRAISFSIVAATLAIAACSDRSPVSPAPLASQAVATGASTARAPVPLAGDLDGLTYLDRTIPCPGGVVPFAQVSEATGTISHLGLTKARSQHCYVSVNPDGSVQFSGTIVMRAANEDELYATYSGSMLGLVPTPAPGTLLTAVATMAITGGSGRFAGASGEAEGKLEVTVSTPLSPIRMVVNNGSIVY